ncbi:hypothetical protein HDR58_11215 [bacterium]|nr:hypothetical protein [bacterium]
MQIALFSPYQYNKPMVSKAFYNDSLRMRAPLNNDVVTFCSNSNDFLSLPPKQIFSRIKASLKDSENKLGVGGEAEVWKIKDTDYCVRIPHDSFEKYRTKFSLVLSEQDKVNHTVAKLGGGATIMPVIKGYTFCSPNITNKEVAKMIELMPQKAFDSLLIQVCNAKKAGLTMDPGWKNIIVNPENQTLSAIDFCKVGEDFDFNKSIINQIYCSLANNPATNNEQRKICAGKTLLAVINTCNNGSKMNIDLSQMGFERFVYHLKYHGLVSNDRYLKMLETHLKGLENSSMKNLKYPENFNEFFNHQKIIKVLVKQLFGY